MLLLAIVTAVSVAAGLAIAFAVSILRPSFHDAVQLKNRTGLPLLGVVSFAMSDVERRAERVGLMRFYAGSGSLLMLLVIGMITAAILAARQAGSAT